MTKRAAILIGDSNDVIRLETVAAVADGAPVELSAGVAERVRAAREVVERRARSAEPVYGVTTGFGALAEVKIPPHQNTALQRNLILSHAAGVGRPLSRRETRAMMFLRAVTLGLGYSGVRLAVIEQLLAMLNRGIHPVIPEKGSVGASGDLAPLAHLGLGLIGEGDVDYAGEGVPAAEALAREGLEPLVLEAKEGLSLVNGTQGMTAVGALALLGAETLASLCDVAGAMTCEGLGGLPVAFDARIQAVRPHPGQRCCAEDLRRLLAGSSLYELGERARVQDPYSLRCMPQVHGATREALAHARTTLQREASSATDNPLVFADDDEVLSGGNFHGQPLALALDLAAMAVAELGNIAERRIEQLVNPALSGLPPFLVQQSGIHSGYMMAQVTAASLVNENKILASPACVDSIPGSASREDHVSMGMTSARKLREVVENTASIVAVEMLCAAQAIDLGAGQRQLGAGTAAAHAALRRVVPFLDADRLLSRDMEQAQTLARDGTILRAVEGAVGELNQALPTGT